MFLSIIKDFNATYQSILTSQEIQNHDFFQISWKICVFFFIKLWSKIVYLFTFQWLRDFAYFPISLPQLTERMTILPHIGRNAPETSTLVSRTGENMFDSFLGTPSSSWSLAFLSPTWFDHFTTSNAFFTDTDSFKLSQFFGILIILGLSSFFNSFLIHSPLSITNLWCLRYSISHNFKTSCISILGVVFGEIAFMLFLILPPPFIQITLTYLESIWPYIFGISLVIWAIFDSVNNSSSVHFFSKDSQNRSFNSSVSGTRDYGNFWKIFQFTFLLSFTEQACCFSYFGSLNLSSSANFLDTYIFAASSSPFFLIVSCLGFAIGSFLTMIIFNYSITQLLYFAIWLGKWPMNLFAFLFTNINQPTAIKHATVLFFKNTRNKIQSLFENIKVSSFQPSAEFQNSSIRSTNFLGSQIFSIFGILKKTLKKIFHFFLFLFSSNSSVQSESQSKKKNFSNNSASFYQNKGIGKFKRPFAYFISIFNNINNWYERSSPFYSKPVMSSSIGAATSLDVSQRGEPLKRSPKQVSLQTLLKLDKFLLTCLITLAFTTIPYYSCDYLFNQFIGITPQDQILNNHSLRVNYTDYSSLLGIQLPDKSSIFNTDVSLYDRAHFMYGEWPTSFESLNYQGELFWTNLRDHRRQKRTRRSTRIKFKNLKSKIATSWKAFKRNDSLSLEKKMDNFSDSYLQAPNVAGNELEMIEKNQKTNQIYSGNLNTLKTQDLLINNRLKNDQSIFSKLFGVPTSARQIPGTIGESSNSNSLLNSEDPFNIQNRRESLSETIKNLSAVTFKDLSSNTKSFTNYSKNWKKVITEKYYQNQIYKILLSSDLKNFLKREPYTQQLTSAQEKELDFLRIKMCHYFDTLRFYFKMKEKIKPYSDPVQKVMPNESLTKKNQIKQNNSVSARREIKSKQEFETEFPQQTSPLENYTGSNPRDGKSSRVNMEKSPIGLRNLPFQFKSMTSLNYHQRFKGSLKPVRELFQISLPNSISFDKSLFNEFPINQNSFLHEELSKTSKNSPQFFGTGGNPSNISHEKTKNKVHSKEAFQGRGSEKSVGLHQGSQTDGVNPTLSANSRAIQGSEPQIYNLFGSNDPFYVGWDKNLRKFILTSRFLSRPGSLNEQIQTDQTKTLSETKSDKKSRRNQFNFYRTYSSWPFFKHQLTNSIERPYSVMYENYFNILNKNLKIFQNININNIDKKSLSFLYTYSLTDPKNKKLVSQLPQNIYKVAMQPTSSQDIFGPLQNTWTWPGSSIFSREYFFQGSHAK